MASIFNYTFCLRVALVGVLLFFVLPSDSFAARKSLEVAGWIPYWAEEEGTVSARDNIRDLDTIHPFTLSVTSDGDLKELSDLEDREWRRLFRDARKRDVEIIPTIMWSDGPAMQRVLSDRKLRRAHIDAIVDFVDDGDFDGIDIDYEAKLAETIDYFSLFLKELEDELGRDLLTCTVEARTPPESLYRVVPEDIEYANDYKEMAKYCDRIEIMAYDQQRADLSLNNEKRGEPYIPVADSDWVRKVIELALEDIPEEKIMLGIPTYGREWTLTVEPDWYKEYRNVTALNVPDAEAILDEYDIASGRNQAGEASFTYFPKESVFALLDVLPVPEGTRKGNEAAAKALLFANATGMTVPVNVVWYSDAEAIEEKIDLAREYDLRGVAIFKIDGEEDEDLWDLF